MWYKRYGYKHPSSHDDGIGCVSFFVVSVLSFSIAILAVVLTGSGWLLLLVIPLAVAGFEFSIRYIQREGGRRRGKRQQYHIKKAMIYIDADKKAKALESIRRAKIYGEIPMSLQLYEQKK